MEPITIIKTVDDKTSDALPELKGLAGFEVEITVRRIETGAEPRRRGGWAKGKVWISDDFDAPLEEFKEYT